MGDLARNFGVTPDWAGMEGRGRGASELNEGGGEGRRLRVGQEEDEEPPDSEEEEQFITQDDVDEGVGDRPGELEMTGMSL